MDSDNTEENNSVEDESCHSEIASENKNCPDVAPQAEAGESPTSTAPTNPLYNHSLHLLKQAVQQDKTYHWESAIKLYRMGVKGLLDYTKCDECQTNVTQKRVIHQKCTQYMNRIQTLNKLLEQQHDEAEGKFSGEKPDYIKRYGEALKVIPRQESWSLPWDRVVGMERVKQQLTEWITIPFKFPHLFSGRSSRNRTVLMYGPSGAGKSVTLRAFLSDLKSVTTFYVQGPELMYRKFENNSISRLKQLFAFVIRKQPCVVVLDGLDKWPCSFHHSGAELSQTLFTELLVQMQGIASIPDIEVVVIIITNQPWLIPRGMRRRMGIRSLIYVPLPNEDIRKDLLKNELDNVDHELEDMDFDEIALRTQGFSPSDLCHLSRDSILRPMREFATSTHFVQSSGKTKTMFAPCSFNHQNGIQMVASDIPGDQMHIRPVSMGDFRKGLKTFKPTTTEETIAKFENYVTNFGQDSDIEILKKEKKDQTEIDSLPKLKALCKRNLLSLIGGVGLSEVDDLPLPRSLKFYLWTWWKAARS